MGLATELSGAMAANDSVATAVLFAVVNFPHGLVPGKLRACLATRKYRGCACQGPELCFPAYALSPVKDTFLLRAPPPPPRS